MIHVSISRCSIKVRVRRKQKEDREGGREKRYVYMCQRNRPPSFSNGVCVCVCVWSSLCKYSSSLSAYVMGQNLWTLFSIFFYLNLLKSLRGERERKRDYDESYLYHFNYYNYVQYNLWYINVHIPCFLLCFYLWIVCQYIEPIFSQKKIQYNSSFFPFHSFTDVNLNISLFLIVKLYNVCLETRINFLSPIVRVN